MADTIDVMDILNIIVAGLFFGFLVVNILGLFKKENREDPFVLTTLLGLLVSLSSKSSI